MHFLIFKHLILRVTKINLFYKQLREKTTAITGNFSLLEEDLVSELGVTW